MRRLIIIPVLAMCCSGCATAQRYHDPVMDLPQSYRSYKTIQEGEAMINLPWWGVFKDPVLQELIREALRNNYDLMAAAARVEEARAVVGTAASGLFPQTGLTAGISRERNSKNIAPALSRFSSDYTTGFKTTWELDLWGKISQGVSSAKAEYMASENARKGVMVSLVADVAETYFKILELDLQLDIAKKTLKTRQDNLDLFNTRYKGGAASELEVVRAEADYEQTAADIPDIERQIEGQENKLSELLGRNPGPIERTAVLSRESFVPGIPAAGLPAELLKNRPDVMEAEQMLRSATAEVGVAIGEFMPSVNMNTFVGGEGNRFTKVFDEKGYTWTLGGSADMNIFDGGKNLSGYAAAQAQLKKYSADYRQKVIGAFREVSDALVNIEKIETVRESQEKQVESLKKATDLSRARYEGGYSSYLEVIDADQQYYVSQNLLARTRGSQVIYYVQLYRALGGGWQAEPITK